MKHYYRTVAKKEFGSEPNIKIREELAEQFLIRQYLGMKTQGFFEMGKVMNFIRSHNIFYILINSNSILEVLFHKSAQRLPK